MKYISTGCALIGALALYLIPTPAQAHGFEGDRFFPPTIQTDDPFATDEFSLGFQSTGNISTVLVPVFLKN